MKKILNIVKNNFDLVSFYSLVILTGVFALIGTVGMIEMMAVFGLIHRATVYFALFATIFKILKRRVNFDEFNFKKKSCKNNN
ncbi:MAG: hypothetical protein FWE22_06515 [Firmicutes bacterium]|nr:hypothetical protein [Bacillota bacterium]